MPHELAGAGAVAAAAFELVGRYLPGPCSTGAFAVGSGDRQLDSCKRETVRSGHLVVHMTTNLKHMGWQQQGVQFHAGIACSRCPSEAQHEVVQ